MPLDIVGQQTQENMRRHSIRRAMLFPIQAHAAVHIICCRSSRGHRRDNQSCEREAKPGGDREEAVARWCGVKVGVGFRARVKNGRQALAGSYLTAKVRGKGQNARTPCMVGRRYGEPQAFPAGKESGSAYPGPNRIDYNGDKLTSYRSWAAASPDPVLSMGRRSPAHFTEPTAQAVLAWYFEASVK